jgi:hypothetical protein
MMFIELKSKFKYQRGYGVYKRTGKYAFRRFIFPVINIYRKQQYVYKKAGYGNGSNNPFVGSHRVQHIAQRIERVKLSKIINSDA